MEVQPYILLKGKNKMTKIIAEFCQNHNGNFDLLKKMIEAAAEAGATHGKMQTIFANTISFRPQFEEGLIKNGEVKSIKRPYLDEYKRLKDLEISSSNTEKFVKICNDNDLVPMTTCFVREHVDHLAELGFHSIKVASYDCASFPLLEEISKKFDEIIVSTGATYDDEVIYAAKILKDTNFSMLHCVTLYPTPLEKMHMARMDWLRTLTPNVGYSDHSLVSETGLLASKAALAVGADIIERHFNLLLPTDTRDGPVSINQAELKELSNFTKLNLSDRLSKMDEDYPNWKIVIGQKNRKLSNEELLNRDYYRGRFASPRKDTSSGDRMVFNWEGTPLS
jgi:N,N'-diacetyllegionaminate synthase